MTPRAPARVLRWPWRAEITEGADGPRRLLERLVGQTLHHGLPAQRNVGAIVAPMARRGWRPRGLALTGRVDPSTDHAPLIDELARSWDQLAAAASVRLPARPGRLSLLVLERAAGRTSFVLNDDALVAVHKVDSGEGRVAAETAGLVAFADHPLVPRHLGRVAGGDVQEALEGHAPVLRSFSAGAVTQERWRASLAAVAADAFDSLGKASVHPAPSESPVHAEAVLRAASSSDLDEHERDRIRAAHRAMLACRVRVRSHGDPSPQNWLVDRDRHVVGVVDLEHTDPHALPGWDVLGSTIAWAEHRGGLRRGTEAGVTELLAGDAALARDGRAAARDAILSTGGGEEWAAGAALAIHAARLGEDLVDPGVFAAGRAQLVDVVRRLARGG